jgi:hypothetical protein
MRLRASQGRGYPARARIFIVDPMT